MWAFASLLPSEHGQLMSQHEELGVLGKFVCRRLTSNGSTAEKTR